MALPVSQIKYFLGDGFSMEFGTISDYSWVNKRGERGVVPYGEYELTVFECLWGIKRRQDKKYILESSMLDSYEDGLKYIKLDEPLYVYTLKKRDALHRSIIMTDGFSLHFELLEELGKGHPFLFTNHNQQTVSFEEFFKNVFWP